MGVFVLQKKKEYAAVPSPTIETVRVSAVSEYSTLIFLANDLGLFKKHALDVHIERYDSGASSFKALLENNVDVATGAEFVSVSNSFNDSRFFILASMFDSPDVFQLVARTDHGIRQAANLRGKTIGLTKKTMGEFFLGRFLTLHNLSMQDIKTVHATAADLPALIQQEKVDAVITFPPHVSRIAEDLGEKGIIFQTQDEQLLYTLLYAREDFAQSHPDTLERFVTALAEAQQYLETHPKEVRMFFKQRFGYSDEYVDRVISRFNFRLSLTQSLLLAMEDEARWYIENNLTDKKKVPNYLERIDFAPLEKAMPEAVTITH